MTSQPPRPDAAAPNHVLTLRISAPDRPGLVAGVAGTLFEHGANILEADQYDDHGTGMFFQRIEFEAAGPRLDEVRSAVEALGRRLDLAWVMRDRAQTRRMAVFVSVEDHCLYDLLVRHRSGELACDIRVIISNHEALALVAGQFGIPFRHVPVEGDDVTSAEAVEQRLLEDEGVDLLVLARYMRILSPAMVERWTGRAINIHHSFLPAFSGARPYHQAYDRGVKLIGATAHYVTTVLDDGPIIEQDVTPASHRDSVEDLVRRGRDIERTVLARAVRWHLEDRVLIHGNRTIVFR
ncbi:MAG: formyltetrahydrofolate deformylase [Candidatus Limnocylindrales bacterium]